MKIQGKATIVTGASRGLGAALARQLARAGGRVVLLARGAGPLDDVASAIRAEGGEAHAIAADVADKAAIHRVAAAAAALAGPIEILVHNAATLGPLPMPQLMDTECEDMERVLAVNLVGPFRLTKALLGPMLLRGGGLVLNVSSDASIYGYPGWGAYGVSKAGLEHLARIWATEVAEAGVRFVTVDPGEMDTRMHADALPEADPLSLASPAEAARVIVDLIDRIETVPNGARLDLSSEVAAVRAARAASAPMRGGAPADVGDRR